MPDIKQEQRVLGFDYGTKRIGIAIGQTATQSATALSSLTCKLNKPDWLAIELLIEQWQPDAIVVGRPSHANGDPHQLWPAIETFCSHIKKKWSLPIHYVDEYLSSFEAKQQLSQTKKKQNRDVDSTAAKILVESWLRQKKS